MQQKDAKLKNELDTLRLIKIFIHTEKEKVQTITSGSILSNSDCLTLSIISCLLASRKGYRVKIGRPDQISRYFHSFVLTQEGEIFLVAGKNRNYKAIEMEPQNIISRLKSIKPVVSTVNSAKKYWRKRSNRDVDPTQKNRESTE